MPPRKKSSGATNILERGTDFVSAAKEILARKSKGSSAMDYRDRCIIPLPEFVLQYSLGLRGLIGGTMLDIIAPEGVGKTTQFFTLCGYAAAHDCPAFYLESENKPMLYERILRCLHTNREIAARIYDSIFKTQAFDIRTATSQISDWLRVIRDPKSGPAYVPLSRPAIIGLDTYSKLMPPGEYASITNYMAPEDSDDCDEKKIKDLGAGSNFEHAKLAHAWTRQLPYVLNAYNGILVLLRHQNEKIEMQMGAGGGSFLSPEQKEGFNKTSIGGKAFHQSAAYQLIISRKGHVESQIQGVKTKVAQKLRLTVAKNSFGPPRFCEFLLNLADRRDTDTYQEPALDYDLALCQLLSSQKMLQMVIKTQSSISCKELELTDVDPHAFAEEFYRHPDLVESTAVRLGIKGYQPAFSTPPPATWTPAQEEEGKASEA